MKFNLNQFLLAIKPEDIDNFPARFQDMVKTVFENSNKVIKIYYN